MPIISLCASLLLVSGADAYLNVDICKTESCASPRRSFFPHHVTMATANVNSRREVFTGAALLSISTLANRPANAAAATVGACPSGANNCFSTESTDAKTKIPAWKWPSGMSRDEAVASLKATVEKYPQEGQNGVDNGGWTYAVDQLADTGYARLEFKSGIGKFAKFFNGGKPFVDDLEFSVQNGEVKVKSTSRVGDSDFGVNGKRLNFIAGQLRAKGWDASGP